MSHPERHPFERALDESWPIAAWSSVTVLVAVSGGADSVALLRGLASLAEAAGGSLVVAHMNHGLRAVESDGDERFVAELAKSLRLPLVVERASDLASTGDGLEAAARMARHEFFRLAAERVGARYIATAHTADDQAETIFHRIIRGTGIAGLGGIPRHRRISETTTLIRPMLTVSRGEVLDYLTSINQPFREDDSNRCLDFSRNYIRHELLPRISDRFQVDAGQSLRRLGELAEQVQGVVHRQVDEMIAQGVTAAGDVVVVDPGQLAQRDSYLVREMLIAIWKRQHWPLQDMGQAKWHDVASLLDRVSAGNESLDLPGGIRATANNGVLRLRNRNLDGD